VRVAEDIEDAFGRYRGWEQIINANGLFDEPQFTDSLGEVFARGRLLRQAYREFDRARALDPGNFTAQLYFARLSAALGRPQDALDVVKDIRSHPEQFSLNETNELELAFVEAGAYLARKDIPAVERVLNNAIASHPDRTNVVSAAISLYIRAGLFTNVLDLAERQLQQHPDDPTMLVNKGFAYLHLSNSVPAIETLSRALEIDVNNAPARLNRAIAYLQSDQLDKAQQDYETLLLQLPRAYPIYFGLGEIAWRRHDTNQAIYNYRLYLSNAPPRTVEADLVRNRLEQLGGNQP